MRPPQRRYNLDQIVRVGRWAWASSTGADEPDVCFDGAAFWAGRNGRTRTSVPAEATPKEGWWHESDCRCELCRPSAQRARQID